MHEPGLHLLFGNFGQSLHKAGSCSNLCRKTSLERIVLTPSIRKKIGSLGKSLLEWKGAVLKSPAKEKDWPWFIHLKAIINATFQPPHEGLNYNFRRLLWPRRDINHSFPIRRLQEKPLQTQTCFAPSEVQCLNLHSQSRFLKIG